MIIVASMQVPVRWTRSGNVQNGVCSLDLSIFKQGNVITGTWETVSCSGTVANYWEGTEYDGVRTAWELTQLNYLISADNVSSNRIVCSDRKRIWFGTDVTISQSPNIPLVAAKSYTYTVYDTDYNYFGPTLTHGYYTTWNMNSTVALSYEITAETPTNLKQRGTKIYEDIYVDFALLSSNAVEYEVVIDDVVTIATTTTGRNIRIPAGTIKNKSKRVKVNIKSKLMFNGVTYYSPVVSISLGGFEELVAVRPTSLRLVGTVKCIEEPMPFAWDITDTQYSVWDFEVWQDGIMVYSLQTNTTKATIPAKKLKSTNSITIRVRTVKSINGCVNITDYVSLNVSNLTSLKPIIKDFTLDGNNLDYDINIVPDVTGADYYEWNTPTDRDVGTTIGRGLLKYGNNSIMLIAYKRTSTGSTVSSSLTKKFDITRDEPIIYSLEPNNININIMQSSTISFVTNEYIDGWELLVNGDLYATGTIERSIHIPQNTFIKGSNSLELNIWYAPGYNTNDIRSTVTESTFTGYGKPNPPTLDTNTVYNTATPTFTWSLASVYDDQSAYTIEVREKLNNTLIETDTITTVQQSHTMINTLTDSTEYIVKVKIKNRYELWSEWSIKEFTTSFSNMPKPLLSGYTNGQNSILTFEAAPQPLDFKEIVVLRKEGSSDWVELGNNYNSEDTITDYTAKPKTKLLYKCRMFNTDGAYIDSNIIELTCFVETHTLMAIEDMTNQLEIPFTKERITHKTNTKYIEFAGNEKPTPYTGTTKYKTIPLEITCTDEELEHIHEILECEVVCYKSYGGTKAYVNGSVDDVKRINYWFNKVVVNLTEINFTERLMYTGNGFKKLNYMNGEYFMDGSINMSGFDERWNI